MNKKIKSLKILLIVIMLTSGNVNGQTPEERLLTIDELFNLAIENNQALKLSSASVDMAQQRVSVTKSQQLPNISASISAFYLGDATIYDKDFSNKTIAAMPHFGNSFIFQANQLVFKGNVVTNSIEVASLQQQLATLNFEKNKQDIKLLISSYYLELFKQRNQQRIYLKNIQLSEIRLKNIEKMHEQGMVTLNDVIRTKLLLSNLNLMLVQINDNIEILNKQLTTAVGLSANVLILPDTTILSNKPEIQSFETYQTNALTGYYDIKTAEKNLEIAQKSLSISKAERMPSFSLFAANSLQRPITSRTPALDMYSNGWQAGGTLSFNIASLYNAPRNIRLSKLQLFQSQETVVLQQQNAQLAVHSAYLKHIEAFKQLETTTLNMQLARENYQMMEKKYLNQLALLIDMLDATNAKLESELQYSNAEINIIFTYHRLLNIVGKL